MMELGLKFLIIAFAVLGGGFLLFIPFYLIYDYRKRTHKLQNLSDHSDALDQEDFISLDLHLNISKKEMQIFYGILQKRFFRNKYKIALHFKLDSDFNLSIEEIKDLLNDFCIKTIVWTPKAKHFTSYTKNIRSLSSIEDLLHFYVWWKAQVNTK